MDAIISSSENLVFESVDTNNINNIFNDSCLKLKELDAAVFNYEQKPELYAECLGRNIIFVAHLLGILQKKGQDICNNCPDIQAGESKIFYFALFFLLSFYFNFRDIWYFYEYLY